MQIVVHRGASTIGGSCIEINHKGARIIFDLGLPLMDEQGKEIDSKLSKNPSIENKILPNVKGLYSFDKPNIDAVILSHAHLDHSGLMDYMHKDIPVYLNNDIKVGIEVGNIFYKDDMKLINVLEHSKLFEYWKPFKIGDFKITPYLIDHSAYGATAFLVEADGEKVFYSGDLRAHGRKSITFEKLLTDEKLKNLDCLLLEGTTLGGNHNIGFETENDVEEEFINVCKEQTNITFAQSAGSNIDRLISFYRTAKKCNKTLVVDLYQYHLMSELKKTYPESKLPPFKNDKHLKVFYNFSQAGKIVKSIGEQTLFKYKSAKISKEEIVKNKENIILRLSQYEISKMADTILKSSDLKNANYIYSMWSGYLKRNNSFAEFASKYNLEIKKIHTSGHAYKKDLFRLIKAMTPKVLIPIHSLNANEFEKEFDNVKLINNGEVFCI